MIDAVTQKFIEENHYKIWGWVMTSFHAQKSSPKQPPVPISEIWDMAIVEFGIRSVKGQELADIIYKLNAQKARDAKAKQKRVIRRALAKVPKNGKTQLQMLKAQQKEIDQKIKEIERGLFTGIHFKVIESGELFRIKYGKHVILASDNKDHTNTIAKKLEAIWDSEFSPTLQE
jgi:hypothetical protein